MSVNNNKKTNQTGRSKVSVSNQVKLDANNPIPFEYGGSAFDFISGQRYIPFLYSKDDFFKTLLEAKTLSTTQSACIETKKNYCAGRGLYDVNGKEFSPEFLKWVKIANAKNQSAHALNRKIFGSHMTFGNTPVEIVRLKVAGKSFVYVYVHSVLEWRLSYPDKDGIVRSAIQSKLFLRQGLITDDMLKNSRTIPLYDASRPDSKKNWKQDGNGVERTMIWLANEYDGYDYYGMPESVSSLIYQVLEYKNARYNLDNLENNMVLGGILALAGNLSQAEADKIGKNIINTHSGDGRRGRWSVIASEEGITKSEAHQFNTQKEGSYLEQDANNVNKIIMANQWDALLAGLPQGNSLGKGNTFLRAVYEIKKKTVIDPLQEFVVTNVWQPLQGIIKKWTGIDADTYELGFLDIDPISALSGLDPAAAVQVNELREAIGLPEDTTPKGKMYLGELKGGKNAKLDEGGPEDV